MPAQKNTKAANNADVVVNVRVLEPIDYGLGHVMPGEVVKMPQPIASELLAMTPPAVELVDTKG